MFLEFFCYYITKCDCCGVEEKFDVKIIIAWLRFFRQIVWESKMSEDEREIDVDSDEEGDFGDSSRHSSGSG